MIINSLKSLLLFGIRKSCLTSGRSLLLCQLTRRAINLTVVIIIMEYHCYHLHTIMYPSPYIEEIIGNQGRVWFST
jgi:hypothetical protein